MALFILVPGGWHGEWVYDDVADRLRAAGHETRSITLTGLDGNHHADGSTNLETHIDDVAQILIEANGERVVLCGHSYGGMVITGVADRYPDRIARLVYIDAYVPRDGESCWDLAGDTYRRLFIEGVADDGYRVRPPTGLDLRARPHPIACFLQKLTLQGSHMTVAQREFVHLTGWNHSPFVSTVKRLQDDPDWTIHVLNTGHDVMRENAEALVNILERGE